jgi:hypothetical protein
VEECILTGKLLEKQTEANSMDLREELNKAPDRLPKETLDGVIEYIRFVMEPSELEPTEEELRVISPG